MRRYCLALDLKNDQELMAQYVAYHQNVWPEILDSLRNCGIENMEIYKISNRLVMIMEVDDNFTFAMKQKMDAENEKVREWEELMHNFQQRLPHTPDDEKWVPMNKIFELHPK